MSTATGQEASCNRTAERHRRYSIGFGSVLGISHNAVRVIWGTATNDYVDQVKENAPIVWREQERGHIDVDRWILEEEESEIREKRLGRTGTTTCPESALSNQWIRLLASLMRQVGARIRIVGNLTP